mmetsp:Transcript_42524/g.100050  ORF Transcript_42524/g.100050 Transcript_42524/m.100050 type:complete len:275 (+) Transcript_42524:58-882(+)
MRMGSLGSSGTMRVSRRDGSRCFTMRRSPVSARSSASPLRAMARMKEPAFMTRCPARRKRSRIEPDVRPEEFLPEVCPEVLPDADSTVLPDDSTVLPDVRPSWPSMPSAEALRASGPDRRPELCREEDLWPSEVSISRACRISRRTRSHFSSVFSVSSSPSSASEAMTASSFRAAHLRDADLRAVCFLSLCSGGQAPGCGEWTSRSACMESIILVCSSISCMTLAKAGELALAKYSRNTAMTRLRMITVATKWNTRKIMHTAQVLYNCIVMYIG